ncbi:hypothetical protein SOVF_201900 [Spinacia oleracea]|nr:hypothetical protein SOVF_201900 [Spinacia oleracea]
MMDPQTKVKNLKMTKSRGRRGRETGRARRKNDNQFGKVERKERLIITNGKKCSAVYHGWYPVAATITMEPANSFKLFSEGCVSCIIN